MIIYTCEKENNRNYLRCIRIILDYIHDPGENFFNPKKVQLNFVVTKLDVTVLTY
jgi:hypothetical protein